MDKKLLFSDGKFIPVNFTYACILRRKIPLYRIYLGGFP